MKIFLSSFGLFFICLLSIGNLALLVDSQSFYEQDFPTESEATTLNQFSSDSSTGLQTDHPSSGTVTTLTVDKLTPQVVSRVLKQLKKKDKPFYSNLSKMSFEDQQQYLVLNQRRLFMKGIGGLAAGLGVAALGAVANNKKIQRELGTLRKTINDRKQELYFSKINKRKETEALQSSIYQLENSLAALKDIVSQRSYELNYSIGTNFGK